ncbi:hypothetical protein [Neosynechococcus sphagnicola]|uniref:hypothetical protein n=1 Tax=Neosynechococcus sphagnicola TaxID=1501145 RepID=UPI001EF9FD6D|nr:hypothetical protein [Neosynechococcus sphagnicola]
MNHQLLAYLPLWSRLHSLVVLDVPNYQLSQKWRLQAEHRRMATGQPGMTDSEVEQFVNYFWKSLHPALFIPPLVKDPSIVDLVIEINADHIPNQVYQPGARGA